MEINESGGARNEVAGEAFRDSLMPAVLCDGLFADTVLPHLHSNRERETQRRELTCYKVMQEKGELLTPRRACRNVDPLTA